VAYAIGDGLEYGPPGRGCSVQGLYLHMGFGTNTYDLPDRLGCRLGRPVIETHADINPSFHIAHYGLNYRFWSADLKRWAGTLPLPFSCNHTPLIYRFLARTVPSPLTFLRLIHKAARELVVAWKHGLKARARHPKSVDAGEESKAISFSMRAPIAAVTPG
jgi:hypothetical protein